MSVKIKKTTKEAKGFKGMKRKTVNQHLKEKFGVKVYKLALDGNMTCPNRDGTLGNRGCIFCSSGGSGEFAEKYSTDIFAQIERAKARVEAKNKGGKYIAYFQSFSNTYAPIEYLKKLYFGALSHPDVVGLAIATRPDCLGEDVIGLIKEVNEIKPVWVELGLQTADDSVGQYIRRGFKTSVFADVVKRLKAASIETVAHIIIGLPNDNPVETARFVSGLGVDEVKFHLLHILKGTDLEAEYLKGKITVLSLEEYTKILKECLLALDPKIIIHRLTGDGDKRLLVAPLWSGDKKTVLNYINKELEEI